MGNLIFGTSSIEESFHSFYRCMLILSHSTHLGKSFSGARELEIRLAHFSRSYAKTPVQSQSGVCCGGSEITASFWHRRCSSSRNSLRGITHSIHPSIHSDILLRSLIKPNSLFPWCSMVFTSTQQCSIVFNSAL